jgi:hypothetical protein
MSEELYQVLDDKLFEALANLHTMTVARVTAVHATTINCRPVINRMLEGQSVQLPDFIEVPPVFLQGGGSYTAHPIAVGDYCLLLFTERCFDRWYAGSDFQPPLEMRMHDYSDGFAVVGVNTASGAFVIPDVITHIGDTYQQGDYVHDGNREQTGNYTLTGNLTINGNLTVNGDIDCSGTLTVPAATIGGINFGTHVHPENDNGGPTGGPQ